tara:strand:- start:1 stop:171 length:171 start_codon:yes stop_codon:yes gene_type:complete
VVSGLKESPKRLDKDKENTQNFLAPPETLLVNHIEDKVKNEFLGIFKMGMGDSRMG